MKLGGAAAGFARLWRGLGAALGWGLASLRLVLALLVGRCPSVESAEQAVEGGLSVINRASCLLNVHRRCRVKSRVADERRERHTGSGCAALDDADLSRLEPYRHHRADVRIDLELHLFQRVPLVTVSVGLVGRYRELRGRHAGYRIN